MRLHLSIKALLLAVAAVLTVWCAPSTAVQSMSQGWFRRKLQSVGNRLKWLKSRKATPVAEIGTVNTLEELAERLAFSGFKGRIGPNELFSVFTDLKGCFKTFSPPAGLALDFSPAGAETPDDAIKNFFIFASPEQLLFDSTQQILDQQPETKSAEATTASNALLEVNAAAASPREFSEDSDADNESEVRPLRTVKAASDPTHILAHIIQKVHQHLTGPSCSEAVKSRQSFLSRLLLRNNSLKFVLEALLVYALVQGNNQSAMKFPRPSADVQMVEGLTGLNQQKFPSNMSSEAGVYDPAMLLAFYDLVKASETTQMKTLERYLRKANERHVAESLFGDSLASAAKHAQITAIGAAVGTDENKLVKVVENIGVMAMYTGDAASILLPKLPRVASFVRTVSFFAFEGAFKQHGHYVIPGLPCGGNLSGSMLETVTGKKLGAKYFVYKYTQPVGDNPLSEEVWAINLDGGVSRYFKSQESSGARYLGGFLPRVCVREALYKKCSKRSPAWRENPTPEQILCDFIYNHRNMFFEVDGKAVYAMREEMGRASQPKGLLARTRRSLSRGLGALRKAIFSKTTAFFFLGATAGGLCAAFGLTGGLPGAICGAGALAMFGTMYGAAALIARTPMPLSLGEFLSASFNRNLDITGKMLGVDARLNLP